MAKDGPDITDLSNLIDFQDAQKKVKNRINGSTTDDSSEELSLDDQKLKMMNERHAFINTLGGKPAILIHTYNEAYNRKTPEFIGVEAIQHIYHNNKVGVASAKGKSQSLGKYWLEWAGRRCYHTVIFDPSKDKEYEIAPGEKVLNLWEGFTVIPVKGCWRLTKRHIWKVLCNKDKQKFKYVMRWFAWMVQNPDKRAEVAIIFKGKQGAGKGFIFEQFVAIFGQHGMNISSRDHFSGKFNGHFRLLVFLFADEAYYPGDVEVEGKIKELITQPKIAVEAKFRDTVMGTNRLHIGMATNNDWVIPVGDDSRRYFINEVDNCYAKNQCSDLERNEYFEPLWNEMNDEGRAAMLYDLLHMDLKGWHPRKDIPETSELRQQQVYSQRIENKIIMDLLDVGDLPGEKSTEGYVTTMAQLMAYFDELDPRAKKTAPRMYGKILENLGCERKRNEVKTRIWVFPELEKMRKAFNKKYIPCPWSNQETKWNVIKTAY